MQLLYLNRIILILVMIVPGLIKEQLPNHKFFQSVFQTLFIYILIANLIGALPFSFTMTSQFVVSFALSTSVFVAVVVYGLAYHKQDFFGLFLPEGVPLALSALLSAIELLSFSSRVISLAVRLSANIISGHTLMEMIAIGLSFIFVMNIALTLLILPIPLAILVALTVVELGIAGLQAYVFVLLSTSYLKDSINLH